MSQLVDSTFRCGDGEALVSYLYGEGSEAERRLITAHVARCAQCAAELSALGSTREVLTHWTPPERSLGFRITQTDAAQEQSTSGAATVLRPAAWWKQPLPAWAQLAAAVVIFASGVWIGLSRTSTPAAAPALSAASGAAVSMTRTAAATPAAVTRDELVQLEQRLKGEIAQLRTSAAPDASGADTRAVMQRVTQMIAASEARQQKELDFRTTVLANDFSTARRIDNANIAQKLGSTTMRVINNQQDINSLAQRMGYIPSASQYVP